MASLPPPTWKKQSSASSQDPGISKFTGSWALIPLVGTQSSLSLTHTEIEETQERIREIYFTVFTHTHEIVITEPFIEAIGTLGSYNYHLR